MDGRLPDLWLTEGLLYPQVDEVLVIQDRSKIPAGLNKDAIHKQYADQPIGVRIRDITNYDDDRDLADIPPGDVFLTSDTVQCEANVHLCCDIVLLDPFYSPIDYNEFSLAQIRAFGIWPVQMPTKLPQ